MTPRHAIASARQAGFTLIELMVGLTLGMLTVAVITQVVVMAEGQKRTTTHGADAQLNGALALYAIQQEAQMAGYGVSANPAALGCNVRYNVDGTAGSFTLAPVVIADGSHGSDTITFLRSGKTSFSVPIRVSENHAQDGTAFVVQSSVGVAPGDLLMAVPVAPDASNWCSIVEASAGGTTTSIPHAANQGWNPSASFLPATGYPASSYLVNLGNPVLRQFALDATAQILQKSELVRGTGAWSSAQDMHPQIVMMKALYGKDTNDDGVVDSYDRATPSTNAEWRQVLSLRVLVVARSAQFEKDAVASPDIDAANRSVVWDVGTTGVPVKDALDNAAAACHTGRQCLSVSLSFLGDDWAHYRYKVYDTVIPLRNRLWNS
ncbi:MAG: prepilin-type N-terminal cleavage/methylation domain-containing protein [Rubrivivax sp.]|nr:MAG: prepilin-type N-terminal cleavage/methylation domain-containing protein [Rubrivivax sp.]